MNGYSDIHYTNDRVAQAIVGHFSPSGRCLDPFKGDGAFLKHLPTDSVWCEIQEERDFFSFFEPVDWIVSNPPFSNLTEVFSHAFEIAENTVFLIPISKFWSSEPRIRLSQEKAGLVEIAHVGTGRHIGFDIGFPFAAMHFKRGYDGQIKQTRLETS